MADSETIETVVDSGLCTSCGTCVSICPAKAIKMEETPSGFLIAQVIPDLCTNCGLCAKICPGLHLEPGVLPKDTDPFTGPILAVYCGYAADSDIRRQAQSGGMVTALLGYLLDVGQINKALVTRMPENGSLRPFSFFAKNQEELRQAQGSKYCPVAVNSALPRTFGGGDSVAVVGIPCQIHGIRNAQTQNGSWKKHISLTIGLFCDRTFGYGAIDYLIDKVHLVPDKVKSFQFRNTERTNWPGNVYIRDKQGVDYDVSSKYRMECKDAFTPARCRLCFDKMNILSDIAVGDAWGVRESKKGFSTILVRTQRGLDVLQSAEKAGWVCLEKISPEAVFRGQGVENRRKQWTNYSTVWEKKGRIVPDCCVTAKYQGNVERGVTLKPYMKQLDWAENLAGKKNRIHVLRAVKQHMKYNKIKARLSFLRIGRNIMRRIFLNRGNS